MFLKRRSITWLVICFAVSVAIALAFPILAEDCDIYEDSEPTWFYGYGQVCAGHGSGCMECYDTSSGNRTCTSGGPPFRCGRFHDY